MEELSVQKMMDRSKGIDWAELILASDKLNITGSSQSSKIENTDTKGVSIKAKYN
jgi:hypothetical protein